MSALLTLEDQLQFIETTLARLHEIRLDPKLCAGVNGTGGNPSHRRTGDQVTYPRSHPAEKARLDALITFARLVAAYPDLAVLSPRLQEPVLRQVQKENEPFR